MRRWAAARPLAVREAPSRQTSVWRTPPDLPCGARPARPLAVREAPSRQTSVWREACPPARRPRRELRSARRLEARPGPAGLAPPSDRAVSPDERDKTLPTHHKTAIPSHFSLAGRTLYRSIHQQASRENFVPHTGPPPGRNSPRTKPGGPNRYKTLPAGSPNGPPGTKLSQHTTKRRYQAISRLQGELFHAYGRGKPSRENFVPHTGPPPGQNSPRSTHQPKQRDKILPARHKTLILACFTHAGRVLSRI